MGQIGEDTLQAGDVDGRWYFIGVWKLSSWQEGWCLGEWAIYMAIVSADQSTAVLLCVPRIRKAHAGMDYSSLMCQGCRTAVA